MEEVNFWKASASSSELNTVSAPALASWLYTILVLKNNENFLNNQVFENMPFSGYSWSLSHVAVPNVYTDYLEYIQILLEKTCTIPRK